MLFLPHSHYISICVAIWQPWAAYTIVLLQPSFLPSVFGSVVASQTVSTCSRICMIQDSFALLTLYRSIAMQRYDYLLYLQNIQATFLRKNSEKYHIFFVLQVAIVKIVMQRLQNGYLKRQKQNVNGKRQRFSIKATIITHISAQYILLYIIRYARMHNSK